MLTREQAIKRLEMIVQEMEELKVAFEQLWNEPAGVDATDAFLKKCGGWEDARNVDEIISEIYAARSVSERGATLFAETGAV